MEVFKVSPRGFCAGVRRALDIVEKTLSQYNSPIYVYHEIVHNKHIVNNLKERGVIFIDNLDEITDISRPVIFSAHGVSQTIKQKANELNLKTIDATCPLVSVVHHQIKKLATEKIDIILLGKASHPEILGTVGQVEDKSKVHIISTIQEAQKLQLNTNLPIGILTQTTLAVDDTKEIISFLQNKFSNIINSSQINICFATTNRQKAIKKLAELTPDIIIIGSKNSSNSTHLKAAAIQYGAKRAWLIDDVSEFNFSEIDGVSSLGISAGASAPEYLVEELVRFLQDHYDNVNINDVIVAQENMCFK